MSLPELSPWFDNVRSAEMDRCDVRYWNGSEHAVAARVSGSGSWTTYTPAGVRIAAGGCDGRANARQAANRSLDGWIAALEAKMFPVLTEWRDVAGGDDRQMRWWQRPQRTLAARVCADGSWATFDPDGVSIAQGPPQELSQKESVNFVTATRRADRTLIAWIAANKQITPPQEEQRATPEPPVTPEKVDHPAHYGGSGNIYEPIKIIEALGLSFHLGNTLKYLLRAGKKGGESEIDDLKKARWYLDRYIEWKSKP